MMELILADLTGGIAGAILPFIWIGAYNKSDVSAVILDKRNMIVMSILSAIGFCIAYFCADTVVKVYIVKWLPKTTHFFTGATGASILYTAISVMQSISARATEIGGWILDKIKSWIGK